MKKNTEIPMGVNEQEVLNSLYQQLGEKVFTEMQNRDESRPAEEFFNDLMFSSLEFCVKISDSIKRIEKLNNPVVNVPIENEPEDNKQADIGATQVIIPTEETPRKSCPRCGTSCNEDMHFCTACGFQWPSGMMNIPPVAVTKPSANNEKALFCTNCGSKLDSDSLFCISCGQRIES